MTAARSTADLPDAAPSSSRRGASASRSAGSRCSTAWTSRCDAGEVHGLVGQNGAGKSTLVKIINGAYTARRRRDRARRAPLMAGGTREARRRGIAMVFQEFSLIPTMPVGQNILLSREPRAASGLIDDARDPPPGGGRARPDRRRTSTPDRLVERPAGRRPPARRDRQGHLARTRAS